MDSCWNMVEGFVACFLSLGAGIALRNSICSDVDGIVRVFHTVNGYPMISETLHSFLCRLSDV